ncbi:hypothetical protein ACJZ2D_015717 [Fusarium nematophilum]
MATDAHRLNLNLTRCAQVQELSTPETRTMPSAPSFGPARLERLRRWVAPLVESLFSARASATNHQLDASGSPIGFLIGIVAGVALALIYDLLRRRVFVCLPREATSGRVVAMPPPRRNVLDNHRPTPSDNNDPDGAIDNNRDDHSETRSLFQTCPHPSSDYRVVRFTVGLVNNPCPGPPMLAGQPFELGFHHNFEASPARPLSLHFDDSHITLYGAPPMLEAPPPPGVIVELGRVDILPDDTQFLAMVEDQIRREVDEDVERNSTCTRPRVDKPWARVWLVSIVLCLLSIALVLQRPTPPSSPVAIIPLIDHLTSITIATTMLCPTIFFNQFLYLTIGDSPNLDILPDKISTLQQSLKITRRQYKTSEQDNDAFKRWFFGRMFWEFTGIQFNNTERLKAKVYLLSDHTARLWDPIGYNSFNWWVRVQITSIGRAASNLRLLKPAPEDSIFIAQGNASFPWIPATSLPREIPRGIRDILDTYRRLIHDNRLSDSCQVLRDCTEPMPISTPPAQVIHPSCFSLYHTDTDSIPNKTAFPALFDQVIILAQLKDTIEQGLEIAETLDHEWAEEKALLGGNQTLWGRCKSWLGGKQVGDAQDQGKIKQLRDLVQVYISRQLWDPASGLNGLRAICHQMDALSDLVDGLYSREAWILSQNASGHVQLWKMPHPTEQALSLKALQTRLLDRHATMKKYQREHNEWERIGRKRQIEENINATEGGKRGFVYHLNPSSRPPLRQDHELRPDQTETCHPHALAVTASMYTTQLPLTEDERRSFDLIMGNNDTAWDDLSDQRQSAIRDLLERYPLIQKSAVWAGSDLAPSSVPLSQMSQVPDTLSEVSTHRA